MRVGIAQRAERLDRAQVDRRQRAAMVDVAEDVGEQRRRALVAHQADRLHDRVARPDRAAGQRLLENAVGRVGADVQDRAHRFALHLRLVVVEQLGQVGQRVAAAELAHQVDRRPAHRRVRRVLQPLDRPPADRPEREQDRRSAARACAAAPRPTAPRRAAGPATSPSDTHIVLTRSNCASSIVARCVMMCRIIEPATSRSIAVIACCRRAVDPSPAAASRDQHRDQLRSRRRSRRPAADPRAGRRPASSARPSDRRPPRSAAGRAPASGRARAATVVAIVAQPRAMRSGGSSLTCSTSIACVRAPDSSRAVVVGDERLVGVRRQQLLGDVVPDRLEAFGAAERRRGDVVVREREQPLLLIRFAHERLERQRQAIGRRAL